MNAAYDLRVHITGSSPGEIRAKAAALRRAARVLEDPSVAVRYIELQHLHAVDPPADTLKQRMRRKHRRMT